jgi:signal peptidase II
MSTSINMATHTRNGYIALLLVMLFDQLTKHIMLGVVTHGSAIPVTPFLNWVMVWNRGISFGMLQHGHDAAPYLLSALAIAVCIVLHRWLRRADNRLVAIALGLVMGGALGNVIDRLRFGAVFDFVDVYVRWADKTYHWPAFNVADASICIGVVLLVLGGSRKNA